MHASGITTGISSEDRAITIKKLVDPSAGPSDFVRPGHIFPLIARDGGVLVRPGHTEASCDLSKLAGLKPAGVICEIINEDGTMARAPDLMKFADEHGLRIITIRDLIEFRRSHETLVERKAEAFLPTEYGDFRIFVYRDVIEGREHVAMVRGSVAGKKGVLVRVHSECMTGDIFRSTRCDCGSQLDRSMELIGKEEAGVVLYLRHEGRGIGSD
jgi:3,4-dihydroxy 2-butanone 4-phosphate synthase/GTP cyclohydrolase II